jgi:hypothetical protein
MEQADRGDIFIEKVFTSNELHGVVFPQRENFS